MATFLELCQKTARESGLVQGVLPTTVTGQAGLLADIVAFVSDAWVRIQSHQDWEWMRETWSGSTIASIGTYTASDLLITDLSKWMVDTDTHQPLTAYLASDGVAYEYPLTYVDYNYWKRNYTRGTQTDSTPGVYTISPDQKLCLGPAPDGVYTLNGEYYRVPQVFSANTDTPTGLPEYLHDIIVYRALMRLGSTDSNTAQLVDATGEYNRMMDVLMGRTIKISFNRKPIA